MMEKLKDYFASKSFPLVLLFGSQARGDTHPFSDVDIAVWLDHWEEKCDLIVELEELLAQKVDIVNLQCLWSKDPKSAYEIAINHQPIVVKDKELYIEFQYRSYMYYFDQKSLFDMNKEAFLQRIEHGQLGKIDEIGRESKDFRRD